MFYFLEHYSNTSSPQDAAKAGSSCKFNILWTRENQPYHVFGGKTMMGKRKSANADGRIVMKQEDTVWLNRDCGGEAT
jgi:hypothetical protein